MKIKRYRGFYDDDGSFQWRDFRRHLKSRWHVAVMRLDNRWQDARALLSGSCNASTWNEAEGDYDGGYSHWRCGKRRGHSDADPVTMNGAHRFNNYVWGGPGTKVEFAPLPVQGINDLHDEVIPFRKLAGGRRAVDTRRRGRIQAATRQIWTENRRAQYRR